MGKGTVLANLGQGKYSVAVDTGAASAAALLAQLQAEFAALQTQITQATNAVASLNAQVQALNDAWAAKLAAYAANPSGDSTAMEKALVALRTKEDERDARQRELTTMILNRGELAKRINVIQDGNYNAAREVWCADYTLQATGEVATIEVPGEPQNVLMVPGGAAHTAADGQLLARELMTGPQAYFNAAILPGWQKFKPTYRTGRITAISLNTADVELDAAISSVTELTLNVNQTTTLSNVPIQYMDCNGEAFVINDNVVVEFEGQNWNSPKIIGFKANPKPCGFYFTFAKVLGGTTPSGFPYVSGPAPNYFGETGLRYKKTPLSLQSNFFYGGDRVFFGSGGIVSWRKGGDPYNFPYVMIGNQVVDCATPEFYSWLSAMPEIPGYDPVSEPYSIKYLYYYSLGHLCGAGLYNNVLYFCLLFRESGVAIGTSEQGNQVDKLIFYYKNLSTNQITKYHEHIITVLSYEKIPNVTSQYNVTTSGNSLVYLETLTPLLDSSLLNTTYVASNPGLYGFELYKRGAYYEIPRISLGGTGECNYKVSFHPTEKKAIFAVIQNGQYGYKQITETTNIFSAANGLVGAEYHYEDGRICTLTISNYTLGTDEDYGCTFTATFSEGNVQFTSGSPRLGFLGDINLCHPLLNSTIQRETVESNPTVTRNFFNGAYTESRQNGTVYDFKQTYLLFPYTSWYNFLDTRPVLYLTRTVLYKNKFHCLFYTRIGAVSFPVLKLISSDFTQAQFQSDTGAGIGDGASGGQFAPIVIGFSPS